MEIIGNHKEIAAKATNLSGVGVSDVGCVRKNNEDNMVLRRLWTDNYMLAVAIDGVGGQEGGEVAAAIAAESIPTFLDTYKNGEPLELLCQAVQQANNDIYERRGKETELSCMSCVLTAAIVDSRRSKVYLAHVGDTRLYLFADGELKKLSHDHSLVGYREEVGDLTEEEAMHHPQRNIISRDVGSEYQETTEFVESATFQLTGKSILMFCSDGLCDMITSAQMTAILSKGKDLKKCCCNLVDAAKKAGGRDNVTVLLVEHTSDIPSEPKKEQEEVTAIEAHQEEDKVAEIDEDEADKEKEASEPVKKNGSRRRRIRILPILLLLVIVAVACFFIGRCSKSADSGNGNDTTATEAVSTK